MNIKSYKFKKDGNPKKVVVEMTTDEAAFIAKMIGAMNYHKAEEVIAGAGDNDLHGEIYGCLVGELFNRYYSNGVEGYIAGDKVGDSDF